MTDQSPSQAQGGEREAFEKWMDEPAPRICSPGSPAEGEYVDLTRQMQWEAWQARAALAAQPLSGQQSREVRTYMDGWNDCVAAWAEHMKGMAEALSKPRTHTGWANAPFEAIHEAKQLLSASPVAMPQEDQDQAVAPHAKEAQELTNADLADELRDMAAEIESENWGASWSFQQYAVVMRDAAAALEATPSQPQPRQPAPDVLAMAEEAKRLIDEKVNDE